RSPACGRLVGVAGGMLGGGRAGRGGVFSCGGSVSGARRWIVLGPLSVQPAELFKLAFLLTVVWLLVSRWAQPITPGVLALLTPVAAVPFVLIVKQPDLGTALLLMPLLLVLLVGAGVRVRLLAGLGLAGLAAAPIAWFALKEYQRERIMVFLDPFRDPLARPY